VAGGWAVGKITMVRKKQRIERNGQIYGEYRKNTQEQKKKKPSQEPWKQEGGDGKCVRVRPPIEAGI